tara:strand:+ start:3913 stop:4809 length:897 start_codon:yes stop_codon:yes gene_type:complete
MNKQIYCKKIFNKKDLEITINFLKEGFKWSNNQASDINKKIKYWNSNEAQYGFIFKDKSSNKPIGAMLTHYQGLVKHKNKRIKVINLSWWYVIPEARGFGSIYMAKKICQELKDCIITNFSATKNAYIIFKGIGFKEINTYTTNFYFPQYLIYIMKFRYFKNIKIKKNSEKIKVSNSIKNFLKKDSFQIKLKINNKDLDLIITKSRVEKLIFNFRISIPRIHIVWASDDFLLIENYQQIIGVIMIKYFAPMISTHCLSKSMYKSLKVWTKHLIYTPYPEINSISSIGSENSISLKNES